MRAPEHSLSSSLVVTRTWPMLGKGAWVVSATRVWPFELSLESAALPWNCRHTRCSVKAGEWLAHETECLTECLS